MAILSKIKNFVTRIRTNKDIEENLSETKLDPAFKSGAEINDLANDLRVGDASSLMGSQAEDIPESIGLEVEETSSLSFTDAYITDEFPMTEARAMVKERDRKVLSDLLFRPETIKKHDRNGNRALFAITAIPTVAYMSFVASSAVALPPVAMGVIGFGIAGGIVSGINKIIGKDSALGSLYRKVKLRFGHAKPKVDLNEYKYEFNKEKSERNALLSKHVNNYSVKKKIFDDLGANLDAHFQSLISTGTSSFAFDDDEISQNILNDITSLTIETNDKLNAKQTKITKLDNEKNDLEHYIEECEDNQKENALRADTSTNAVMNAMTGLLNNYKESLIKKEELHALLSAHRAEEQRIENERDAELAKQEQVIENLKARIAEIPESADDNAIKQAYLNALTLEETKLESLKNIYATKLIDASNLANREVVDFMNGLNNDVNYFIHNGKQSSANYIKDRLNEAVKENSLIDKVRHLMEVNENGKTVTKFNFDDYTFYTTLGIETLINNISANPDLDIQNEDQFKLYFDGITNHNAEIVATLNANLLLEIEAKQQRILEIISQGEKLTAEFNEIKEAFDVINGQYRNQLTARRQQLVNEAEKEAIQLRDTTKPNFEVFKKEQMDRLNNQLYDNPTL